MNSNITQEYATQISLVPNDLQTHYDQICRLLYELNFSYFQIIYYKNSRNEDFFALGSLKHFKVINYDFWQNPSLMIGIQICKRPHQTVFWGISGTIYLSKPIKTFIAELGESVTEQ